jgi:hypothetical protein
MTSWCCGDSFTFILDDVRTSQETFLLASTSCYWDNFTFILDDVRASQETPMDLHGVAGIALLFCM